MLDLYSPDQVKEFYKLLITNEVTNFDSETNNTLDLHTVLGDKSIIEEVRDCPICLDILDFNKAVESPEIYRVS